MSAIGRGTAGTFCMPFFFAKIRADAASWQDGLPGGTIIRNVLIALAGLRLPAVNPLCQCLCGERCARSAFLIFSQLFAGPVHRTFQSTF